MQPFSDEKNFTIEKNSVVVSTPASIGLSKYYEYVLRELNKLPIQNPKEEELRRDRKRTRGRNRFIESDYTLIDT